MSSRREFLQGLGITTPSVLGALHPPSAFAAGGQAPITPAEVFEIYVEAYLRALPPQITRKRGSLSHGLAVAQGYALAIVLAELQARRS
jgi:hypothetical protein